MLNNLACIKNISDCWTIVPWLLNNPAGQNVEHSLPTPLLNNHASDRWTIVPISLLHKHASDCWTIVPISRLNNHASLTIESRASPTVEQVCQYYCWKTALVSLTNVPMSVEQLCRSKRLLNFHASPTVEQSCQWLLSNRTSPIVEESVPLLNNRASPLLSNRASPTVEQLCQWMFVRHDGKYQDNDNPSFFQKMLICVSTKESEIYFSVKIVKKSTRVKLLHTYIRDISYWSILNNF